VNWWLLWALLTFAVVVQAVGLLWLLINERRDRG